MPADFIIKEGDTSPVLTDTLTLSNGEPPNLTGSTLAFQLRAFTASTPQALTGTASVTEALGGKVSYTFTTTDTATAGSYEASWLVTFAGGGKMTFPTTGYIWVEVEENLTGTRVPRLVELAEAKAHLSLPGNDRVHDTELVRLIEACAPLIEQATGPILPRKFDEWHDGGGTYIMLRRRPATSLGTTPLLRLVACSEYLGPIEWPLKIIPTPDQGELYSCELDQRYAQVVRRTAGGGVQPFPYGPRAVHAVYEAGQETVPMNVKFALCEALREFWQTTQAVGRGRETVADEQEPTGQYSLPYLITRHALGMIQPMRRHPSVG
jgi:hypothetical protein